MRSYSPPAKLLHWLMAAVIVTAWAIGWWSSQLELGVDAAKVPLIYLHKNIASTVLLLIALRIAWRLTHPAPPLTTGSPLQHRLVGAGHAALYAAMVAMPITGWAWSSAAGYEIPVAGLFHLPPLVTESARLEPVLGTVHMSMAWILAALVAGHVGFALKHHWIDGDDSLRAMLPGSRK